MKSAGSGLRAWLGHQAITALICMVLIAAGFTAIPVHAAPFPIAGSSAAINCAFDGTNYLVGVENHASSPPAIGAQLIDASGNKVGGLISTGRSGISTNAAFDGTNYLLIWENDPGGSGAGRFQIYGQFISRAGAAVGAPFAITTAGIWFDGVKTMAFGGGNYLVTYTRLINPDMGDNSTNRYIAGRIVSPGGSMGSEFRISTGYGDASDIAFDGTNFFVVWTEDQNDTEIRGRFVSPAGVPGTEISVNASAAPSDNPKSVAFDGTNYMVVWNDEVSGAGTWTWDVFGQRVSTAGAKVGGVITITSEAGPQLATTVAFDGTNYLAVWLDMKNDLNGSGTCDAGEGTCWDLFGQYVSKSGSLAGSKVTINADGGNQMGGAGFINGKYLALINNGIVMGESGITSVEGAYGLFITPLTAPAAPTISLLSPASGSTGSAVTLTGTNFVSGGTTVTFNGTLSTSVTVTDSGHVTAYVPSGAATGPVKVVTAGGTATSSSFTVQMTGFPIATSSASMNFAFDGTNYLVGVENHQTSPASIGAQLIDASGTKVGGLISTGSYGMSANAAFDGTNYLLIWENDPGGSGAGRFQIYGQFISRAGAAVGAPFAITTAGIWFDGVKTMAFGSGTYLVTYTRLINPDLGDNSTNRYIAGRIVSPDGSMGSEFRISTGYGDASDVAFDGTNFFVVWTEDQNDYEIRGRFVSPAGVPGTEISVNASTAPSDNPKSVTFDGTNYMVVWNDEVSGSGTGTWDVFGQRVSTAGAMVGGVITVTSEAGPQMATSVAFDGTNYLATWVDMSNSSNWNLFGQYIGANGALAGSKVTIDADAGNQMGGVGFINGKYLALLNNGITMGSNGITAVEGVYGLFIAPLAAPAAPTIGSLSASSGAAGSAVTITGTNFVSGGTAVSFNGTLSTSVTVTDSGHVTAYVPSGATTGPIKVITAGGTATSSSFTVLPPSVTLTVYLSGTGSGTVTATSGVTLSCSSPDTSCSASASYGTSVTLSESASLGSTFSGWSGACTGTPCTFTLDADKTATATFTLQQNLRKGFGPSYSYYGTVKSALANAADGDIILARMMLLPDLTNDALFDKNGVTATLQGGYTDAAFTTRSAPDFTSVSNPLTIESGTLILDQVIIK